MTWMNWISIGITIVVIVVYITLKIYVKRKMDQYDGLGGIITRNHHKNTYSQGTESFPKKDKE